MVTDDTPRLTGTQLNYLLVCPRKLWLFSHHIEMERENDAVALGQLLHEESFQRQKKEVLIDDLIRIDFFDDEAVHDIKKGRSMEEAHRAQILYYLWYLKQKGVEGLKGVINYPKQRRSVEIELTPAAEAEVEEWIRQAQIVVMQETPPLVEAPMRICRKCSYSELCWG
ncbi:MAG TPA: CRISPR-associated protein Cas4 [Alphaproteobacteria bacterium]|nr:CRISPR-associated protein Cas4 [Alphaproteobacteria bacterium]